MSGTTKNVEDRRKQQDQQESPPMSSIFRDPTTYAALNRFNSTILRRGAEIHGSRRIWSPYGSLFFNSAPTPVFCDYRQLFGGGISWPQQQQQQQFSATGGGSTAGSWRMPTTARSNSVEVVQQSMKTTTFNSSKSYSIDHSEVVILESHQVAGEKEAEDVSLSMELAECSVLPSELGGLRRNWIPPTVVSEKQQQEQHEKESPEADFTLCTYNVLCQTTLKSTRYLYGHCPTKYLNWNYRWPLLEKEFETLDADVFCLQEVEECYYESHFLKYFQKRGYDGLFKRRMGAKPDGCATFWRTWKFDLIHGYPMDFQVENSILDRDNVALFTVLQMAPFKADGSAKFPPSFDDDDGGKGAKIIIVANTHLLFNPGRGDVKLCQAAMLVARMQKISSMCQDRAGVLICGDLNAIPFSPLYKFLVDGRLHYVGLRRADVSGQLKKGGPALRYPLIPGGAKIDESTCTLEPDDGCFSVDVDDPGCLAHRLSDLVSAYGHKSDLSGAGSVSTMHSKEFSNVDYILYRVMKKKSSPIDDRLIRCRAVLSLPDKEQVKKTVGPLPNQFCASDHLPLIAKFAFAQQ